jgi:hypothetical protein
MNWRRGLFRLWIAFSAIWIALIAALVYHAGAFEMPALPAGATFDNKLQDVRLLPLFAFAPPLAIGFALLLVGWVAAGFRSPRPNQSSS